MPDDDNYDPTADLEYAEVDDDDQPRTSTAAKGKHKASVNGQAEKGQAVWEGTYNRSWDVVQEDAEGGLQSAVDSLIARGRRKRAEIDTPLRRSIIRHMFIILDLSESVLDKDFRPSRFELTLQYMRSYVVEWFDQNPLGQIGMIIMRDRLSEVLIPMGGNPQEILSVLTDKRKLEPSGEPSLQNGLVMAKGGMSHLPSTSSLEILVVFSSISTADPDGPINIHQVLSDLSSSRVRTSIISLSGEIKICRQICQRTGGKFGVAMDEDHLRELLWETIPPPAQTQSSNPTTLGVRNALAAGGNRVDGDGSRPPPVGDLMVMGFPVRLPPGGETLCVCHGLLKKGGYLCPRCGSKLCDVPTDCEVCGLMVVSSPHLARSFWFLFPVAHYDALTVETTMGDRERSSPTCYGCDRSFKTMDETGSAHVVDGISPTGRYRCARCFKDFCSECDLYIHDTLHTCPGCSQ